MRILVSAYSCETGRGGEGEIGWRLVHRLARDNDIWVITRANLRAIHEAAFAQVPKPERLRFIYFDLPWIFRFYKRGRRFFLIYYYFWQFGAGLVARRQHRQEPFDVLHHLIGGMDWMPAGVALCPGPFVWGPVGSEDTHPVVRAHMPPGSRIRDRARAAVRWWMRTLDPFVRFSGMRARVILSHTIETMPRRHAPKLRQFVQTGIENLPALARVKTEFSRKRRLRIVYAGELKDWKGARIALEAALIAFRSAPDAELRMVGDGPLRTGLERLARQHPDGDRVAFLGRLPMERLVEELHEGDLFIYPSFHHGLSTIVLQAMLTGLPVVCIEGDATARAVGQEAGVSVSLDRARDPAEGVAEAIVALAADEPRRKRLAVAAQRIGRQRFSYETLAEAISDIYREVHEDRGRENVGAAAASR